MDRSLPLEPFAIDSEIARAETPPAPFYSDPRWFTRITERVLARSWHALGLSAGLEAPGASRPITLLPGALDEELVLVRGEDGVLRLLSNVCTHRGMLVVEAECQVTGLRCRYHGRRFGLDGCFQSMPKFDQVEGFPTEAFFPYLRKTKAVFFVSRLLAPGPRPPLSTCGSCVLFF